MTWAVHNIHAPAVQIDANGCHTVGGPALELGEPIFTMPTKDEAEQERVLRKMSFYRAAKGNDR